MHVLHHPFRGSTPRDDPPASGLPPTLEEQAALERVGRFLERLARARYFGKLTISFQNGKISTVTSEQVMKVDDLG